MAEVIVKLKVNGKSYTRAVEPRMLLSDFLREELELKGTHVGCEHGVCGTCTVLVDGETARSCLVFAAQVDGAEVRTIESLAVNGRMNALQEAFWEKHGLQCGFCTPGMLMSATELLEKNPDPSLEEIREAVSANLCRCTGYYNIVEAVQTAVAKIKEARS
ncbi:MAG: (2Fe-2S)-binding protein [Burkholderiales bacterium]|jgi:carbon-monoxide dehydrogenase small subunit|nr:(2Fe-2S)-binding protein [Burkholderiales bacterium]